MSMIVCNFFDAEGEIKVDGRIMRFEFSKFFGPIWLNKDGTEKKNQNVSNRVWNAWYRQWYNPKYGAPEWWDEKTGVFDP